MTTLSGNIRYGARMLVRRPGLSALAIGALEQGIGVTAMRQICGLGILIFVRMWG